MEGVPGTPPSSSRGTPTLFTPGVHRRTPYYRVCRHPGGYAGYGTLVGMPGMAYPALEAISEKPGQKVSGTFLETSQIK